MGLMPTPQGAPPPGQQPPAAPDASQAQDEQSNVSPEEQQQYDEFVKKAGEIIYGDGKVMPEILHSLEPAREPAKDPNGGNPAVLALANTAVQVVQKLDQSAKDSGYPISDDVLYHGGSEVVAMLAEVAEAANIHAYSEEEIQGAFYQAIDNYRPIAERMGRTSADTLKGQFQEISDADQQGKLGEVVPGLDTAGQGAAPTQ